MATNYIKIEVDYANAKVKIGDLKMSFDELGERATATRNRINKAYQSTENAMKGSLKALTREREGWINLQQSLSTTNAAYSKYQAQIDKLDAKIAKITDTRRKEEKALKNSANGLRAQIAAMQTEMDNRILSNKQYRIANQQLQQLKDRLEALTDTRKEHEIVQEGSVASYEREIQIQMDRLRNMNLEQDEIEETEQKIASLMARKAEAASKSKLLNKAMAGTSSSAGAAGSAVTELGRTIGDAPFGLMGMANNIQQLSQQFVDLSNKSGGTKQALQSMLQTMIGPAGVVVAINIITSALVAYSMRKEKAKEKTQEFSNELLLEGNILKALRQNYLDTNKSLDERIKILDTLALTDKNLQEILKDQTLTEEERTKKAENYIETMMVVEEEEAKLAQLREDIADDGRTLDELKQERLEKEAEMIALKTTVEKDGSATARLGAALELKIREQQILKLDEQIGKYDTITQQTLDLAELRQSVEEGDKKIDEDRASALDELAQTTFDLRQKILDNELSSLEKSEVQNVEARRKVMKQLFDLEEERLEAERQKELENITDQATINAINEKFDKLSEMAGIDFRKQLEGAVFDPIDVEVKPKLTLKELLDGPKKTEAQKWAAKQLGDAISGIDEELANRVETTGERNPFVDRFGVSEEDVLLAIDTFQQGFQAINDVLTAQADKEIAIETNRTNALNDSLRERLANEKLSADQRDKINQEIARNKADLVKKENEINKKRFDQQKAFNISMAVIDTFVAANQALKDESLVTTFAKVAAMVSIIGTGLANVASISSQKFTGKAMPSARLSSQGGASAMAAPDFNVVGASGQNQLAEAIGMSNSEPLKAYVVSSDVTSAQEMDRKIVEGASI
jgi:hypothetical protein